jgi:hypothetical protein
MPEADKNKIPRSLHGMKDTKNQEITVEQLLVNAAVTIAASLQDVAETMNDICANLDAIREINVKRGLHDGILAPDEAKELLADEDEEPESDEPEK